MATITYIDTGGEFSFIVVLLEVFSAMQLSWYEVMERKMSCALA